MKLFKVLKYFSYKDPIPDDLKSFLVHKFTHVSCISSYIWDTCRHFKTRIEENNKKDNKSLHSTATCFDSFNSLCFKIIDSHFTSIFCRKYHDWFESSKKPFKVHLNWNSSLNCGLNIELTLCD